MELVTCALASEGRDDVRVRKDLRKTRHDVAVESPAHSVLLFIFELSGKKRSLLRVQTKILAEIVIDIPDSFRPERIFRVGLALMHEDTLDHTVLLGDLRHVHEPLVRIAAVLLDDGLHPVALVVDVLLVVVLVPKLDLGTGHRNIDDTDLDVFWKDFDHLATEEVYRTEVVSFAADRWNSGIPLAHLAVKLRHVHGCDEAEARVVEVLVLLCRPCARFHVGLTDAQIDVEVRIRLLCE